MARVLVVDEDPWIQRMVSSVLGHAGHTVHLATDGWEGLLAAEHTVPDLLVVGVKLPTGDGWRLVETLRERPEMAQLRVLFLAPFTEQDRRGPGFRRETDEVLVTPFRLEDLKARVDQMLAGAAGAAVRPPAPTSQLAAAWSALTQGFDGDLAGDDAASGSGERGEASGGQRTALSGLLEQFGAASVLMLMDLERRTGVLIVTGPGGRGRIYLREGRVLRARLESRPELGGALAVYQVLGWNEGRFEFHPGSIEGEDEIGSSTSFLLLEGARLADEDAASKRRN